jgi:hypothetical protein
MLLVYILLWVYKDCPGIYVNGDITSWGIILLAAIILDGVITLK